MRTSLLPNHRIFTTKQLVAILLTKPEAYSVPTSTNPPVAYIRRGLQIHFGASVSDRHTRRLIAELEAEGVITREITACQPVTETLGSQASNYTVIDFYKAFKNLSDLAAGPRRYKRRIKIIKTPL